MKKQVLLMMMALLPMVASADDSGNCGYKTTNGSGEWVLDNNVKWTYVESTHTLTISGNGAMDCFGFLRQKQEIIT